MQSAASQGDLLSAHFLPALLLQAGEAENTPETGEVIEKAWLDVLGEDSLWSLLGGAGPVAQVVLITLLVFSVVSWAVAWSKYRLLSRTGRNNASFLSAFRSAKQLVELAAARERCRPSALVTVFEFGYKEVARQVNQYGKLTNLEALERSLRFGAGEEAGLLRRNVGWLATTASATPFIGLLGTVWGILQAFRGLGQAGGATLRAVAPGIADALVATACGLFAAIPALIFYNYFSNRIREVIADMENFSIEFFNMAERNYGEKDGLQDSERR